ncbi:MAG: cysteine desulfurase [Acidobacteria bacterium]|nr:cysteine desulfurase [Acidobacteriota bacterium]
MPAASDKLNIESIRRDFPILNLKVHGRQLVYLDNAATTQKPQVVLDAIQRYYTEQNSNVHRGVHYLSQLATREYEGARVKIQRFINAAESHEVIFTHGATEGINLIASSYGRKFVHEGDEVIISAMEHHSNIVPWQMLCEQVGAKLRIIPINEKGELLIDDLEAMINARTRLIALVHLSNALGTINPVKRVIDIAHSHDVPVLLDGAQATSHLKIDVQELDCDFYVFSGHKVCGPTGIGVLYGKSQWLESMPPFMGGGDMISSVSFEKTTYNSLPYKFEAGTPNIEGAIGLGVALDYLTGIGIDRIAEYENELLDYATEVIGSIPGVKLIGTAREKSSVLSFTLENIHPHDIGTILDQEGIAIRAGHHCAQPVMKFFNVPATARASFSFYNTKQEIDTLAEGIQRVIEVFG